MSDPIWSPGPARRQTANIRRFIDLVRNELTPFAETGSITVEELFGIRSFAHVHQMVSTISARLRHEADALDALRHAFPMGSMTGAPKPMAMELIERYEDTRRGLFSGAVGYMDPEGDFDFNVVIRSIMYHAGARRACVQAGGAIVADSDPEREYQESLVKADALLSLLGSS